MIYRDHLWRFVEFIKKKLVKRLNKMKRNKIKIFFTATMFLILISVFITPFYFAHAQGIGVICANPPDCTFRDLVNLARNIINFLIIVSIPAATIAFAYAGFLFMTAQGNSSKISQARGIFIKVLIGFLFVLAGWLIVRTITSVLIKECSFWNPLAIASYVVTDNIVV